MYHFAQCRGANNKADWHKGFKSQPGDKTSTEISYIFSQLHVTGHIDVYCMVDCVNETLTLSSNDPFYSAEDISPILYNTLSYRPQKSWFEWENKI